MSATLQEARERTEKLEQAIEHYCTTDRANDEKLKLLSKAECYMKQWQQSATLSRQRFAEHKVEGINPWSVS